MQLKAPKPVWYFTAEQYKLDLGRFVMKRALYNISSRFWDNDFTCDITYKNA